MSRLRKAIGYRQGDEITLSNQWATVTIRNEWGEGERDSYRWLVSGDTKSGDRCMPTAAKALAYALMSLGVYAEGRLD